MSKRNYSILILFCCLFIFFACQQALALDVGLQYGGQSGLGTKDLRVTIAEIVRTAMGILGIVVFILLILGGIYYFLSQGDPEKENKAKKIIISALIGLVIILSAYAVASYIINKLVEATGSQQPGDNEIVDNNGPQPTPPSCIGTIPANSTFCPEPNATGLTGDTQGQLVPSCSVDNMTKCEYICPVDYNIFEGNCVNGDPLLPFDYQAYYSFTTGANAAPTNLFDGTAFRYSGGTSSPDPTAISNGVLNLDGSHYVRINNFTIGPSFTAVARAKSNTEVWNTYGWIISTQNANGFLIHPNAANNSWNGFIYDIFGNRSSYILIGTYSPPADVKISDWHTYGLQYDNGSGVAKMIMDGQVVVTKTFNPKINRGDTNRNIIIDIGHDLFSGTTRYGLGQIDWFYIYDRALY